MLGRARIGARVGIALALASLGVVNEVAGETRRVVITGDTAPGVSEPFNQLDDRPFINSAGQVGFRGFTPSWWIGMRAQSNGALTTLMRSEETVPGPSGGTYSNFIVSGLAENGEVLVDAQGGPVMGLFLEDGFSGAEIGRAGGPAPGGGTFLTRPDGYGMNGTGLVGYSASTSLGSGVFTSDGFSSSVYARAGDAAPGTGGGTFNGTFTAGGINASGGIAFRADTTTGGGIFRADGPGAVASIARTNDAAPGGGTFTGFSSGARVNASGQVLLYANVTGANGLFRGSSSGSLAAVARTGGFAPDGGTFTFVQQSAVYINDANQVVFSAATTTSGALFRADGAALTELARVGDLMPDGNGRFGPDFNGLVSSSGLAQGGQVVFHTTLTGTANGAADDSAIILTDGLERVVAAREGQARDGSTIATLVREVYVDTGSTNMLNDHGQVTYHAALADGRQAIYVYTPDLHWRQRSEGTWDTPWAWTLSLRPGAPHRVIIDPDFDGVLLGPSSTAGVRALEVGSPLKNAVATLRLSAGGALNVSETMTVHPKGVVDLMDGALSALSYQNNGVTRLRGGSLGGGQVVNRGTLAYDSGVLTSMVMNLGVFEVNGMLFNVPFDNQGEIRISGALESQNPMQNLGTITLNGGSWSSGTQMLNAGTVRGNGTIGGVGMFSNYGLVSVTGGTLNVLQYENFGTIQFESSGNLHVGSGVAENHGTIKLFGGVLTGGLTNHSDGVVVGPGAVFVPFTNDGTVQAPDGSLNLLGGMTNNGLLELGGATAVLSGGAITNNRLIQGSGRIGNVINNAGTIEAVRGTLTLAGAVTNPAGGLMNVPEGGKLLVTGAFASNAGTITLSGGTFDRGTVALANTGTIGFTTGASDFFGPIANNSGGKVIVSGGGSATFHSAVTNSAGGELRVSNGSTAVFFAPVTNNGTITGGGNKYFELGGSNLGPLSTAGTTSVAGPASITAAHIREAALTVAGRVNITPDGTTAGTSRLGMLTIQDGGVMDLGNNDLVIDAGDLRQVEDDIATGRLTASSASAITTLGAILNGSRFTTFSGQGVSPDDVLVKYTYFGDTNFDGRVSIADYLAADRGAARGQSGWANGDVDYSGIVDGADFFLIDNAFLNQGGVLATAEVTVAAAVPEPSVGVGLVVVAGLLSGRRVRRGLG